jgi:hypothetical protein
MRDDDGGQDLDGGGRPQFADLFGDQYGRPVAAPLSAVSELLGEDLARVAAAASGSTPTSMRRACVGPSRLERDAAGAGAGPGKADRAGVGLAGPQHPAGVGPGPAAVAW